MSTKRVLVLPDCHLRPSAEGVPSGEDTESLKAVGRYVDDYRWDEVVVLGDLLDLDCISYHNSGKPKLVEGRRLQKDYDYANRWLDVWQRRTTGAKWTLIEGNHEYRAVRYAEAFPAMAGKVEVPVNLQLRDRGIKWVPYWSEGKVHQIGNAYFGHGRHTNEFHPKKHLSEYGVSFYYGHVHDVAEYSRVTHGNDKTICAASFGCLCRYEQPWLHGRPTKWQQAFGVFHVQPNGFFNSYTVKIFGNHFVSPEGHRY